MTPSEFFGQLGLDDCTEAQVAANATPINVAPIIIAVRIWTESVIDNGQTHCQSKKVKERPSGRLQTPSSDEMTILVAYVGISNGNRRCRACVFKIRQTPKATREQTGSCETRRSHRRGIYRRRAQSMSLRQSSKPPDRSTVVDSTED